MQDILAPPHFSLLLLYCQKNMGYRSRLAWGSILKGDSLLAIGG